MDVITEFKVQRLIIVHTAKRRPHSAHKRISPAHKWSPRKQLGSMAEFRESRTETSNWILSYLNPGGLVSL